MTDPHPKAGSDISAAWWPVVTGCLRSLGSRRPAPLLFALRFLAMWSNLLSLFLIHYKRLVRCCEDSRDKACRGLNVVAKKHAEDLTWWLALGTHSMWSRSLWWAWLCLRNVHSVGESLHLCIEPHASNWILIIHSGADPVFTGVVLEPVLWCGFFRVKIWVNVNPLPELSTSWIV